MIKQIFEALLVISCFTGIMIVAIFLIVLIVPVLSAIFS